MAFYFDHFQFGFDEYSDFILLFFLFLAKDYSFVFVERETESFRVFLLKINLINSDGELYRFDYVVFGF